MEQRIGGSKKRKQSYAMTGLLARHVDARRAASRRQAEARREFVARREAETLRDAEYLREDENAEIYYSEAHRQVEEAEAQREAEEAEAERSFASRLRSSNRVVTQSFVQASQSQRNNVTENPHSSTILHSPEMPDTTDFVPRASRGPAKQSKAWGDGNPWVLKWNKDNLPYGDMAAKLSSQIGIFSRNGCLFPLTIASWKGISERSLSTVWGEVKEYTNAPDGYQSIFFKQLGLCWKHHKNRVKKKYVKPTSTKEELLALKPKEVLIDQWPILVDYWLLPGVKAAAAKNLNNRKGQFAYPRTGRTSFVHFEEELRSQGKSTDKYSIWKVTRVGPDGNFIGDDGAADIEAQFQAELQKIPIEERDTEKVRDKVFEQVIGKDGHGHIHCRGVGLSTSSLKASSLSNEYESRVQSEAKRIQDEFEERDREREENHRKELDELRSQVTELVERDRTIEERCMRMMIERFGNRVYASPNHEWEQNRE